MSTAFIGPFVDTRREYTRLVVQDEGRHYILRVKGNQEVLKPPVDAPVAISPSGGGDDEAQSFSA